MRFVYYIEIVCFIVSDFRVTLLDERSLLLCWKLNCLPYMNSFLTFYVISILHKINSFIYRAIKFSVKDLP